MTHNSGFARCALCNSDDAEILCATAALKSGEERDVTNVMCNRCGLIYNSPMPAKDALTEYYRGEFSSDKYGKPIATETQYEKILASVRAGRGRRQDCIAVDLRPFLSSAGRVLDVGCSTGALLAAIQKRIGCAVYGIEPDPLMARAAKEHYGIADIAVAFFEEYAPPVGTAFDLIILRHVLEHLRDPNAAIERLKSWLAPRGHLYFAFPNAANFSPSRPLNRCFEYGHLHSFTPFTAGALLLKHGMKIVRWSDDPAFFLQIIATPLDNPVQAVSMDGLWQAGGGVERLKRTIRRQPLRHLVFRCKRKARSVFWR